MVCVAIVRVCVRVFLFYVFACLRVALWLPLPGQYFYFQEVLPVLAAKHCIMQANAELHQSFLAKQKKKFGEEIARLQVHTPSANHWSHIKEIIFHKISSVI